VPAQPVAAGPGQSAQRQNIHSKAAQGFGHAVWWVTGRGVYNEWVWSVMKGWLVIEAIELVSSPDSVYFLLGDGEDFVAPNTWCTDWWLHSEWPGSTF